MCGNGGAWRLIYCRINVGVGGEMNGRRKKKKNGFRSFEAFARANMRSTRANCSLDESARANIGSTRVTTILGGVRSSKHPSARANLRL